MSRPLLLAAAAASVAGAACDLALPWLAGAAVTAVVSERGGDGPLLAVGAAVALRVGSGIAAALALARYRTEEVAAARRFAARAALERDPGLGAGDVATRVLLDAGQLGARGPIVLGAGLAVVTLLGALGLLAAVHWLFLVALVATFLVVSVVLRRFLADTAPALAAYRAAQARICDRLVDARTGAETIRANGRWREETERVLAPLPDLRRAAQQVWDAQRSLTWRLGSVELLTQIGTVVAGAWLLAHHAIAAGQLVAALGYAGVALAGLEGLEAVAGLNVVKVAGTRLRELVEAPDATSACLHGGPVAADLSLRGLVLADGTVVPDLDLPAGSLVAVTGPAEARSLLACTLAGTVPPRAGTLRADGPSPGRALAGPRPAHVGDHLAELVALGATGRGVVRAACDTAQITALVDGLPDGFATPVEQVEVSGGEWQRLALAQALARGAGLVVLDDATSSLDHATEERVVDALRDHPATVVLCTSRARAAARADLVVVLEPVGAEPVRVEPVGAEPAPAVAS